MIYLYKKFDNSFISSNLRWKMLIIFIDDNINNEVMIKQIKKER